MDIDTINTLINCLNDNNKIQKDLELTIKDISYSTLVMMGEEITSVLTGYLENNKDGDSDINWEVANILLDICKVYGNKTPLKVFMDAAKDKDKGFRSVAIRALGYIGNEESYKLLLDIVKDSKETYDCKMTAVSSLGDLSSKDRQTEILNALNALMSSLEHMKGSEEDVILLKNNIIDAINRIVNKDKAETIGEVQKNKSLIN